VVTRPWIMCLLAIGWSLFATIGCAPLPAVHGVDHGPSGLRTGSHENAPEAGGGGGM